MPERFPVAVSSARNPAKAHVFSPSLRTSAARTSPVAVRRTRYGRSPCCPPPSSTSTAGAVSPNAARFSANSARSAPLRTSWAASPSLRVIPVRAQSRIARSKRATVWRRAISFATDSLTRASASRSLSSFIRTIMQRRVSSFAAPRSCSSSRSRLAFRGFRSGRSGRAGRVRAASRSRRNKKRLLARARMSHRRTSAPSPSRPSPASLSATEETGNRIPERAICLEFSSAPSFSALC